MQTNVPLALRELADKNIAHRFHECVEVFGEAGMGQSEAQAIISRPSWPEKRLTRATEMGMIMIRDDSREWPSEIAQDLGMIAIWAIEAIAQGNPERATVRMDFTGPRSQLVFVEDTAAA